MNILGININILKSPQSKLFLLLSIIALLISFIKYFSIKIIIIQIIFYIIVCYEINCYVYGGCSSTGWLRCLVPMLTILLFILDYLKLYNLEKIFKIISYYVEKINLSNKKEIIVNDHKIIF